MKRRNFLKTGGCAAMTSFPFLSGILDLAMMNNLAARQAALDNDYKALVCIGLSGGLDSFNMLVPSGDKYDEYEATRGVLALPQQDLLAIDNMNNDGRDYGLHPSMSRLQSLYQAGNMAFLANVGTLIAPIADANAYTNQTVPIPPYIYSHVDQYKQWQTSVPQHNDAKGWGGRIADVLDGIHNQSNISMNISLSGYNIFQNGDQTIEYGINDFGNGAVNLNLPYSPQNAGFIRVLQDTAMNNILQRTYSNIFEQTFASTMKSTLDHNLEFSSTLATSTPLTTEFSDNPLSTKLKMVARTIKAYKERSQLDINRQNRQIFFINFGGVEGISSFDMHGNLSPRLAENLALIDTALHEFYTALGEIEATQEVTTFTISDFGRTLTTNGNIGSDHAWGGNHLIMGGAVNGGNIYGTYPDLYLDNNPLNISSRGVMIPTTSTDEYFAELALWFGVPPGDFSDGQGGGVFPNITNFYSPNPSDGPIGFMSL